MEANELRIGNYVSHNSNWFYRGEEVVNFQWSESDWSALGECTLFLENVDPIPLTEEWLFKFGFNNKKDYFTINNIISISSCFKRSYILGDKLTEHIECVHQLQNLYFALTGTELWYSE
jgi:hypothetical protein